MFYSADRNNGKLTLRRLNLRLRGKSQAIVKYLPWLLQRMYMVYLRTYLSFGGTSIGLETEDRVPSPDGDAARWS